MLDTDFPVPPALAYYDGNGDHDIDTKELLKRNGDEITELLIAVIAVPPEKAVEGVTVTPQKAVHALLALGNEKVAEVLASHRMQADDDHSEALRQAFTRALYAELGSNSFTAVMAKARSHHHLSDQGARSWIDELKRGDQRTMERRFPDLRIAPLDPKAMGDVWKVTTSLIEKHLVTMVGESHPVDDERLFIDALKMPGTIDKLKKTGATFMAVEIAAEDQLALDHLLKTGDAGKFSLNMQITLASRPNWVELMRTAYADGKGLKVVAVDGEASDAPMPSIEEDLPADVSTQRIEAHAARERGTAQNIAKLAALGKVLVWYGSDHVMRDTDPFPNTRVLMENSGITVGSLVLENPYLAAPDLHVPGLTQAHNAYFHHEGPEKSFAYPANRLGKLARLDDLPHMPTPSSVTRYAGNTDYMGFLTPEQSQVAREKYDLVHDAKLQRLMNERYEKYQREKAQELQPQAQPHPQPQPKPALPLKLKL